MMMCGKKLKLSSIVTYLPKSKLRRHLLEKRRRARENSSNGVGGRPRGGREEDDRLAVASGGSSFFRGKGGVPAVLTARPPRAGARFNSFCCAPRPAPPRPYPRESILSKGGCRLFPIHLYFALCDGICLSNTQMF